MAAETVIFDFLLSKLPGRRVVVPMIVEDGLKTTDGGQSSPGTSCAHTDTLVRRSVDGDEHKGSGVPIVSRSSGVDNGAVSGDTMIMVLGFKMKYSEFKAALKRALDILAERAEEEITFIESDG
ncbi:hypothetical protein AURDEDRAFT_178107 [Auricularia subglabra TFB-10046 SS5]|uniref:Uncharacterized protein n=1 Tax=Auricularia subglabra (strain TFB-10046 / SS5) TaxID=717982 RepID=J0D2E8_AURST|nr:hypothetical protein AURDEDRAFT_178107 [Auricularia subglabra TFB-10046 SS5]